MNCHAAFALCRTPEEKEMGTGRLIPVLQRQGVSYQGGKHQVLLDINEKEMYLESMSYSDAVARMERRRNKIVEDE